MRNRRPALWIARRQFPLTSTALEPPMIGDVPSEVDELGELDEQFDVVALVEPLPVLERMPVPLQSVPLERVADASIEPATLGTDEFVVP
jgi:hypothetical protein